MVKERGRRRRKKKKAIETDRQTERQNVKVKWKIIK